MRFHDLQIFNMADSRESMSNHGTNKIPKQYNGLNGPSYSLTRASGTEKYALPPSSVLQAFREVFEYLIEDFKTYKPLLSAVKQEYEMMLVHQREAIRDLEPLKSMLVTVSEQCEKKLLAMKQEEKSDMITMKGENRRLQNIIEKLRDDKVSLQVQVLKLTFHIFLFFVPKKFVFLQLQEELGAEYLRYRNECDARVLRTGSETYTLFHFRKMLIADINELKYQQEDSKKSNMEDDGEGKEDVTFLKLALKKAREDLDIKNQKLSKMEADYGDVVPRRDFEKLEALHEKMQTDTEKMAEDNKKLMQEHRQGVGPEVPRVMRFDGQVRNRRLGKRDTSLLIKDIWQEKAAHDAEKPTNEHEELGEFLYMYLQRRFGVENMIVEWGYNLHDACNRYSHDPRIGLFYRILQNEVDEAVYHDQLVMLEKLYTALTKVDLASGNQGSLSRADLEQCLKTFFPLKEDDSMEGLIKAAEQESPGDTIPYKNLFTEDEEGRAGPFVDKIREQDKLEQSLYVKDITAALGTSRQ
ncbi:hypothetical protein QZH41_018214, partial [Actinostola sp. cb2023]